MTKSGELYVADTVEPDLRLRDEMTKSQLKTKIIRFESDGTYVSTIGREGIDGTPFPFIDEMYVTGGDRLVVVCRTVVNWQVFAFDSDNSVVYSVQIDPGDVEPNAESTIASLTKIVPTRDELIFKIDYFSGDQDDLEFSGSGLRFFDPASDRIVREIELPTVRELQKTGVIVDKRLEDSILELLGATDSGVSFCVTPIGESAFRIIIVSPNGEPIHIGAIELEDSEALYRRAYVTPDGILAALIGEPLGAHVYLWRYDRIIAEVADETR